VLTEADRRRLDALHIRIADASGASLGYPSAKDFDYSDLAHFLQYPINNVGDPFAEATYRVETREFEREVVSFFADLFRAPADDWWGYVTNGGTEGNLYGLYLARELLPKGVVYYSEHTHYSVSKNLHFLGMRHIMIRAQESGEIDYEDLRETLKIHRDVPPIVFANIGTTMTEARDDVRKISGIMDSLAMRDRYIHSDAALDGAFAAFLDPRPHYDFADGADSVAISGHKFIGAPIPCGVVVARKRNVQRIAHAMREHHVVHRIPAERPRRTERLAERIDHRPPELLQQLKGGPLHQAALGVRRRHLRHRALDQRIEVQRRHVDLTRHQLGKKEIAKIDKALGLDSERLHILEQWLRD